VKIVKRVLELLQVNLPIKFRLVVEPPDIVTYLPGRVVVKRILICRSAEYSLEDLSESSARTLIESYSALLKSLPSGVGIHILKEELNTEKFLKKLANEILNTQVDLESASEEHRRVRLQAKLHKLKSLYEAILNGKPFIKATLLVTFTVSDSNSDRAKSLADYYESVVVEIFQKHFNLHLERATREEIVKYVLGSLGLDREVGVNPIIVEASKLSPFQQLVIDKITPSREGVVIGFKKDTLHPVSLKPEELYYHLALIGPTGRGKTTLLASIVEQVVADELAKIYAIDFKGDLENYLASNTLLVVKPETLPLSFLKPPPGVNSIDWRSVVLDAVSHVTGLPIDRVSSALSALERAVNIEESLKSQPASTLVHFLEFLSSTVDYATLKDVLEGNVIISLKERGVVFQNTYAALFIGILRNTLLKSTSSRGALVLVDDAWRVLRLKSIAEIVREGRSRRLGVVISTQSPEDIPLEVLENISHIVVFGSRNGEYIEKIRSFIGLSEDQARVLFRLSIGEAIYINTVNRRVEVISTAKPLKFSK
jgi:energy-coupling factor transporter ATP-binding protein EcfA2